MATIIDNRYRVAGVGVVDSKLASQVTEGDTIIHTGGATSVVKMTVSVSKMYVKFIVDTYDRFGKLESENTESRKYKITRELGVK
jgi:hypothetical protein